MSIAPLPAELKPLCDLVVPRPERPETVLTLENAVTDRLGTMRSFELPPSVKRNFDAVLNAVAEGRGHGFWVQSEYGGGKTHFLAALTALLGRSAAGAVDDTAVWAAVNDPEVRSRGHEFVGKQLLPVAVSCKGILPIDGQYSRALLNLLMDAFERAVEKAEVADRILVRDEEVLYHHYSNRPADLRASVDAWCHQQYRATIAELHDDDPSAAARAYLRWCREVAGAEPDTVVSVVDWLTQFCRQLCGAGFDGLLVVIDEFATLQNLATTPSDVAAYEDVLEALGWLAPGRLRDDDPPFGLYTVVASQKGQPVKLAQRFSSILLLAQNAQQDYEIIVSRRVRTLRPDRLDDIDRYYRLVRLGHPATYAVITRERFREVFPLQPRVFDAIWRITSAGGEVAAARFGIASVWSALQEPAVLDAARLLTVSELLRSEQFQIDLNATPEYREAFLTFRAAREACRSLGFSGDDADLAARVLDALFVDYLAFRRSPRRLSTQDLAEAVLAESDSAVVTGGDQVLFVLMRLKQLRQVDFEASLGAQFVPDSGGGPTPAEVLNKAVAELAASQTAVASAWAGLLTHAGNPPGLLAEFRPDQPKPHKSVFQRVVYNGAVEFRSSLGRVPDITNSSGRRFHILVLAHPDDVKWDATGDPRVAIVVPGALTSDEETLCRRYLACETVLKNPQVISGPTASDLRAYLEDQRQDLASQIVHRQRDIYRQGRIITCAGLGLDPGNLFRSGGLLDGVTGIGEALLGAAYVRLDEAIRPALFRRTGQFDPAADSGKLFAGLFAGSSQSADIGAAQNFGPGLGLSTQETPTTLSPDPERYGVALLLQRLAAQPSGVRTDDLYDQLCAPPFGVPAEVVTLWLLACVARETVGVERRRLELRLRPGAKARLRTTRASLPDGVITPHDVRNLDWSPNLRGDFAQIRVSQEAPFGEIVAYGKVIDPTLRAQVEPEAVPDEEQRLQSVLKQAAERAVTCSRQLQDLADALGQTLPAETRETLERLGRALGHPLGYSRESALQQLRGAYPAGPDELAQDSHRLQDWEVLASHGANLATLYRTMADMVSRLGTQPGRYAPMVTAAQREVLPRFDLPALMATRSAAEAVGHAAADLCDSYVTEYRAHHRAYYETLGTLAEQLPSLLAWAQTLARLNGIKRTGPPTNTDVKARLMELARKLQACPSHSEAALPAGTLVCSNCRLDPIAIPPGEDMDALHRAVNLGIQGRVNTLKATAILQALAQTGDVSLRNFLDAIQADQFDGLRDVLTDSLVDEINRTLEREGVVTVRTRLMSRLAERYPAVQKAQIAEVAEAFHRLLEDTFAEQERERPGANVHVLLGE